MVFAAVAEWVGLILAAIVIGSLLGMIFARGRLVRRVRAELGNDKVLLVTGSRLRQVKAELRTRRPGEPGILMLLKSGLYYHSWITRKELFIPGASITYIGVGDGKNGHGAQRGSVILHFLNAMGKGWCSITTPP